MTSLYVLVSRKELLRARTQLRGTLLHFSDYDCCLDVCVEGDGRAWVNMESLPPFPELSIVRR